MPIRTPGFNVMNFGQAYGAGQDLAYNRMRNETAAMELEEAQNIVANRAKAQEIREGDEAMPDQIAKLHEAGLFDEADELRNHWTRQHIAGVEMIRTVRNEIDADNYYEFRYGMIQSGSVPASYFPEEYSDEWFKDEEDDKLGAINVLTRQWLAEGAIMEQDLLTQDGQIIWSGNPFETTGSQKERREAAAGADGDDPWEYDTNDANLLRGTAASLFQGTWDPITQRISGLNREQERQAQAISEEAERLLTDAGGPAFLPYLRAVTLAARKLEIDIPDLSRTNTGGTPNDPQGVRQFLNP